MGLSVLGIAGSLRARSYNLALLRAAQDLAPPGMDITIQGIHAIPTFNEDVEAEGDPAPVVDLKQAVRDADAVLFATPEYNRGLPGGLKNAVDWLSRPPKQSVLDLKPVGLMGASTGIGATAEAQRQLRAALAYCGAQTMAEPEFALSRVHRVMDAEGRIIESEVVEELRRLVEGLGAWTEAVHQAIAAA
jgi:chromate reductase